MTEWIDKRPHGKSIVRNTKIKHTGRYWDAYRRLDNERTKDFFRIQCDHCVHMIGPKSNRANKKCNFSEDEGYCRLCTPFECIQNGHFQQKGSRPADTERIQEKVEEFVDKLLEGKR